MKKTLQFGFGRQLQNNSKFIFSIYSSQVKRKFHTKNQPPTLLICRDSFEEDLKIKTGEKTSKYFPFFCQYCFQVSEDKVTNKNQPPRLLICGDSYGENLKIVIWKTTYHST